MFNAGYRKEAVAGLNRAVETYKAAHKSATGAVQKLYDARTLSVRILKGVDNFVSSLKNKPYEIDKIIGEIRVNYQNFQSEIQKLEDKSGNVAVQAGLAGAGAAMGAGFIFGGPVLWIAGLGAGIFANSKNKRIAEEAESKTRTVKTETNKLNKLEYQANTWLTETVELNSSVVTEYQYFTGLNISDWRDYTDEQAKKMMAFLNASQSLSSKINKTILQE
jgi:hypothetical protein